MIVVAGSAPDPMEFEYTHSKNPIRLAAYAGKTLRYPKLVAGENTGVFIVAGQSLAAGGSEGLYTPVNSAKCDNLNIDDGGMYVAADPLLGCGLTAILNHQGSPYTRLADKLITAGKFDRVILIPVAYGGTKIAQWDAMLHRLIIVGSRRAKAHGINFITAVLWQQGESDTSTATQASYTASFNSMKAKVDAEFTAPWVLAKSTYIPGATTSTGIRAAVNALVDGTTILAGPDMDTLNSSYRYDDQHWNLAGNQAAASLWFNSLSAIL